MTIRLSEDQKRKITNSNDLFSIMQEILLREEKIDQAREHFWMIGLANNNMILYIELVSLGGVKATTVEPMNVFRIAVLKGAVSVMMVHNHPSGQVMPSEQDKDLTDRLIQVGRILDIIVLDHLIITLKSYFSFANVGLMEELAKSTKWVPQFELIARIRKEEKQLREQAIKAAEKKGKKEGLEKGIKIQKEKTAAAIKVAEEKGEANKSIKVAKASLKEGLSTELIVKLTGLTKAEVERLKGK